MKKIFVTLVIILSIFLIYIKLKDDKVLYVSISDMKGPNSSNYNYTNFITDYLEEKNLLERYIDISDKDFHITDLIRYIDDNKEFEERKMKNILIKADILTISIGYNDIIYKILNNNIYEIKKYIDTYIEDLEKLYILLREYSKEKIIMLGYYNMFDEKYDDVISYMNNKIMELSAKYDIYYIDIEDIKKYNENTILSIEGEHIIFNKIRNIIDNT